MHSQAERGNESFSKLFLAANVFSVISANSAVKHLYAQVEKFRAVRLKTCQKPITKTRKYENTKARIFRSGAISESFAFLCKHRRYGYELIQNFQIQR